MEEAIKLYEQGLSALKVAEMTGVKVGTLYKYLKKRGVTRSNKENSRRYDVDHDFFEVIDTEEKAYWLGFLYADGYITRNGSSKHVGLSLGLKDKGHVERFKAAVKATYEVKEIEGNSYGKKIMYARLIIISDKMFDDLKSKGVVERKSLILTFPDSDILPKELEQHFIRGYFDGDGSWSYTGKRDDTYRFKLQGTSEFLDGVHQRLNPWDSTVGKRWPDDKNSFSYEFGAVDEMIATGEYMYRDATIYLERKYKRYCTIPQSLASARWH